MLGEGRRPAEETDFRGTVGARNAKRRGDGDHRKRDSGQVKCNNGSTVVRGNTDGTMRSIAGALSVRMRMRGFNRTEAENQQDADDRQPASEGARLELCARRQFRRVTPYYENSCRATLSK